MDFRLNIGRNGKALLFTGFAVLLAVGGSAKADDAPTCSPGIPCTETYTPGDGSNAAKSNSSYCDADLMNQMYARAFLEASRDYVLAGELIQKPDSVLEYTCFDKQATMTAIYADYIFSGTNFFYSGAGSPYEIPLKAKEKTAKEAVNIRISGTPLAELDPQITDLVLEELGPYIDKQYGHTYLGGSLATDSSISTNLDTATNSTMLTKQFMCSEMQKVWHLTECANTDGTANFRTFSQLASVDPRTSFVACTGTGITSDIIELAKNKDKIYANSYTDIANYYSKIKPVDDSASPPVTCADPIPTGLLYSKVDDYKLNVDSDSWNVDVDVTKNEYKDYICSNPGCYYDPESEKCVP